MGEKPSKELIKQIKEICSETTEMEIYIHHIHIHKYGQHTELTFHIKLPGNMKLKEVYSIVSKLEQKIKNKLNIEATIHSEPLKKNQNKNND